MKDLPPLHSSSSSLYEEALVHEKNDHFSTSDATNGTQNTTADALINKIEMAPHNLQHLMNSNPGATSNAYHLEQQQQQQQYDLLDFQAKAQLQFQAQAHALAQAQAQAIQQAQAAQFLTQALVQNQTYLQSNGGNPAANFLAPPVAQPTHPYVYPQPSLQIPVVPGMSVNVNANIPMMQPALTLPIIPVPLQQVQGFPVAQPMQLQQQPQQVSPYLYQNQVILPQPQMQQAPVDIMQMQHSDSMSFTVQDSPQITPSFNGVNLSYPNLQLVHHLGTRPNKKEKLLLAENDPPIYAIPDFLTPAECDFLIDSAQNEFTIAPVVGPGVGTVSASRTSSTCYLAREDLPLLMEKVSRLTNKPVKHCELPQVGRYLPTQQYRQHYDAFDLSNDDGRRFALNGGQRVVTVLIYLNTPQSGGHTRFPALFVKENSDALNDDPASTSPTEMNNTTANVPLEIKPRKGMAIVFFPATVDGLLDKRVLHAALPAVDTKYVSQIWIRQTDYEGQPSVRLPRILDHSVNETHQDKSNIEDEKNVDMDLDK